MTLLTNKYRITDISIIVNLLEAIYYGMYLNGCMMQHFTIFIIFRIPKE